MNKLSISLLIFLSFLGVGIGMLNYQSLKIQEKNQQLLNRLINSQNPGEKEDPYLKRQVKNTIIKNASEIQKCYNQMLVRIAARTNPEKDKGKVVIDWQINEEGEAIDVGVVRNPFNELLFSKCLENTIKAIKFPQPPFGITKYVEHSFLFKK